MAPNYSMNMMLPMLGTGTYGSYDQYMPSSMMSGMGGMNGMYGTGMYNMMLEYQLMMQKMQEQQEVNSANHAAHMHEVGVNNKVKAHLETQDADFATLSHDAAMQEGIDSLYKKVKAGDQKGICEEYDKLLNSVYTTFKGKFPANQNPALVARRQIENMYSAMISANYGGTHDLRSDIEQYGDGAFKNGFMQTFKSGHHNTYIDNTMDHIYGESIDEEGSKKTAQQVGKGIGGLARFGKDVGIGATAGVGLTLLGNGLWKWGKYALTPVGSGSTAKAAFDWAKFGKKMGRASIIGAAAWCIGDLIWSLSTN